MMQDETKLDPNHSQIRPVLRTLGPLFLLAGLIFLVVGVANFFSSMGSFGPPRLFWCIFVGMPLLAIGVALTAAGYAGAIARYQAGETAPVVKDAFNYLANGASDGVRSVTQAVHDGLTGSAPAAAGLTCPACQTTNPADAKFCKHCGRPLAQQSPCPHCRHPNDPDAKFCDACGQSLT